MIAQRAAAPHGEPLATTWTALGTTVTVLVAPEATRSSLDAAAREVFVAVSAMDEAASRFRSESEGSLLNAAAGRRSRVSPLLLDAIQVALRAARLTAGRVDPTLGKVIAQLGYDRDFQEMDRDGPALAYPVFRACPTPGWQAVELDAARRTVRLPPGVELDLGATAKALCADRAASVASRAAGCGALVSLGGDVSVAGTPPAGGWRVRITDDHRSAQQPDGTEPPDCGAQTVAVFSGGLATSGTSARRWVRGGEMLHHLVDPGTGAPARTPWRTVSVAASSCVDANIASTAGMVMGADALAWLSDRRLPSRLVAIDGTLTWVAGWPAPGPTGCVATPGGGQLR
ncbi:MAG: FAD:protein FMN transferase [Acidimicrobiales bacterium]